MLLKILQILGGLIAIALLILAILQLKYTSDVDKIWHSLASKPATTTFTKDTITPLPAPVQRYFLHAIAPGTPLANSVELQMQGSFKLGQKWLPMQASEILSSKGLVWKARVGEGLFQFFGSDYYANGTGSVHFTLWGLIPVANAQSPDINRAAIGRLAGELVWLPTALLPQQGVTWKAIDNNTIQASLKIDNEPVTLTLVIDNQGRLLKVSFPRWGNQTADGHYAYIPFGGEMQAERTFAGLTIPSQMGMGWWFGSDNYTEFFRATIEQAQLG